MREKDFKPKFHTTAEALKSLFEEKQGGPVSSQFLRWKLWMQWSEIVGETIAQNSEPISYYNGTLYLHVKNSTWMQQMTFMSENIKNAINQKFKKGYVKEIRFTLDRKGTPDRDNQEFQKNVKKVIK